MCSYYTGYPVVWPNLRNTCGAWRATVQDEDHWFNNDKTCYSNFQEFYVRTIPDRFSDIRNPAKPQLNVALEKTFRFGERYSFQLRGEAFNVTNTPIRPGPNTNFGSRECAKLPKTQNNWLLGRRCAATLYV